MKAVIQHRHFHLFLMILAILTFIITVNYVIKAAAMCEIDDLLCVN
jgi:hypothetical protein